MLLALGAASAALDAVKSLTSSNGPSTKSKSPSETSADLFGISAGASAPADSTSASGPPGLSQISPGTLSALLAAQSQSSTGSTTPASTHPASALQHLFSLIDANGDGQITQSEFEGALGAGGTNIAQADQVFSQLDRNGDGTVSLGELSSALHASGSHGHGHHHAHIGDFGGPGGNTNQRGSSGPSGDPLLQSLQGASTNSVTNSDGSTTTSLTYADGSKVTLTTPAPTTSSSAASSSYNLIEQLIQRQANAISVSNTPLSVNA
jgi:Ca2+-binding EF-hand superfamily protein